MPHLRVALAQVDLTVGDLAGVQERLGRDAAAVQAGSADLVLLDQHHGLAELCRSERGGVPTASAAEDDEIGLVVAHCCSCCVEGSTPILALRRVTDDRGRTTGR